MKWPILNRYIQSAVHPEIKTFDVSRRSAVEVLMDPPLLSGGTRANPKKLTVDCEVEMTWDQLTIAKLRAEVDRLEQKVGKVGVALLQYAEGDDKSLYEKVHGAIYNDFT
jgi:hypothetical protein